MRRIILRNLMNVAALISITVMVYSQNELQAESQQGLWWYLLVFLFLFGAMGSIIWVIVLKRSVQQGRANKKEIPHFKKVEEFNPKIPPKEPRKETKKETLFDTSRQSVVSFMDTLPLLPVFLAKSLPTPKPLTPLPVSNDEGLLSAIEELETADADEELRLLSLKVLAAFRTRNAVDALSKLIQNDQSDEIKIKAIQILTEFNHESVFEPILLACADSSKRVRTFAVQALSKLNIERSEAWMRIAESDDPERLRLCASAAIESGFAERVFDRLLSKDTKQANEAMALLALLIKADETTIVFRRLAEEKNQILQKAILKVIRLTGSDNALGGLYLMLERKDVSDEVKKEIDEIIESITMSRS